MTESTARSATRIVGTAIPLSFFLLAFSTFALLDPILGSEDPAETARRIVESESSFRLGVLGHLLYGIGQVVVAGALYFLLRPAGRNLALLAAFFRLVWAITWIPVTIDFVTALRMLEDPALAAALGEQLPVLAGLHLNGYDIYYVGLPFWSISATLMSWALHRGPLVPRGLALFGIAASAWCVVCSLGHFIRPGFVNLWVYDSALALFELALAGWLLFRGVAPRSESATPVFPSPD